MPELDEKRVREIVKEEITDSEFHKDISELKGNLKDVQFNVKQINLRIDSLKEMMNTQNKFVLGLLIAIFIFLIGIAFK